MSREVVALQPDEGLASRARRRQDVQGLRGIAVLLVVLYHAGLPLRGGFVGVDVFLVISGFVITGMLLREWEREGRIRFGRFYVRRVRRLAPALAVLVGVTTCASWLVLDNDAWRVTVQTAIGSLLLTANVVTAAAAADGLPVEGNALLHTWSLSVEEQFYLLFPLLLLGAWAIARRRARPARTPAVLAVGALSAASLALAVAATWHGESSPDDLLAGYYATPARMWEFGAGSLLALIPGGGSARGRASAIAHGFAGVLLLLLAATLLTRDAPFPGPWTLLPVVAAVLLIRAGGHGDTLIGRALQGRRLSRVGDWSYSLYLWHWPCVVLAAALWPNDPPMHALAALCSVAPAVASYRWVEQPLRK